MKILLQVCVIFGLYWLSQCIESILPFTFPASIISLLILLFLLMLRVLKVEQVQETANFLLGNLSFFFLPATVSIMNYVDVIWENIVAFGIVCMVSTFLTFAVTVSAVRLTTHLLQNREGEGK